MTEDSQKTTEIKKRVALLLAFQEGKKKGIPIEKERIYLGLAIFFGVSTLALILMLVECYY